MQIQEVLNRIADFCGHSDESELLRFAFLMSLRTESLQSLSETELEDLYCQVAEQLVSATEQHITVSEELDRLADTQPCEFSPEHVWTLVRAIKAQGRCLNLYLADKQTIAST